MKKFVYSIAICLVAAGGLNADITYLDATFTGPAANTTLSDELGRRSR
jgi:hypothetical protein